MDDLVNVVGDDWRWIFGLGPLASLLKLLLGWVESDKILVVDALGASLVDSCEELQRNKRSAARNAHPQPAEPVLREILLERAWKTRFPLITVLSRV